MILDQAGKLTYEDMSSVSNFFWVYMLIKFRGFLKGAYMDASFMGKGVDTNELVLRSNLWVSLILFGGWKKVPQSYQEERTPILS